MALKKMCNFWSIPRQCTRLEQIEIENQVGQLANQVHPEGKVKVPHSTIPQLAQIH